MKTEPEPHEGNDIFRAAKTNKQRVIDYLFSEFERLDLPGGAKIPPSRALAQRLNVSVSTVQQAYRELASRGHLQTRVGNGTFLITPERVQDRRLRVAVNIHTSADDSASEWTGLIAAGILKAAACETPPISVLSILELEGRDMEERTRHAVEESDGLICLVGLQTEPLISAFEAAGKPCVHFHPPHMLATSNFVTSDFYTFSHKLTRAGLAAGCRSFALILGKASVSRFASAQLRISGMAAALGDVLGREARLVIKASESMSVASGYRAARELFTNRNHAPDMIHCAGDNLALGVLQYLSEAGIRVPDEVMVSGGSGLHNKETATVGLSMMEQPIESLAQRAVAMLIQRIRNPRHNVPGEYIPGGFFPGRTTTAAFNQAFQH